MRFVDMLSGEFFLHNRPNGGTVVLLRSLMVTTLVCAVILPLKSYLAEDTVLEFSSNQLKMELGELIPWYGAIFAGVYTAFYTRFSAQWSYLASLYNQMMAISVSVKREDIEAQAWVNWKAAFIEDALDLHLAQKSMFSSAIAHMLDDFEVVSAFIESTINAEARLVQLEQMLNCKARRQPNTLSDSELDNLSS